MEDTRAFLGRGFSFPPRLDQTTGRFVMCSAEEDIRQSIYLIVMTRRRERAMLPDFGCDVHNYVFGLPDDASLSMVRSEIVDALTRWEPRIINVGVQVDMSGLSEGKVVFSISYTVRATNNPNNLVFPYYLYEGVGLE
ncbi:GPW/gp25 family protein [Clostridiaceae bacterium NSJ-31]|uniref:GPW/gp25 family protein n=1 Tax=Ligaoa zhengdingensis TaxID=2763658 RepID=A0A926I4N1_9FIRM|nr:GPW/gp25 family protein [Ligaoa zhengdingensis]MBC8546575.1 GPW/gp25 family protein [Ligaoa zhengdingensis]